MTKSNWLLQSACAILFAVKRWRRTLDSTDRNQSGISPAVWNAGTSEKSEKCLIFSWPVQKRYLEDGNDKLKLLILLCGEDDEKLQIAEAAAGGLAMITAAEKKLCVKMTKVVCTVE